MSKLRRYSTRFWVGMVKFLKTNRLVLLKMGHKYQKRAGDGSGFCSYFGDFL